MIKGLQTRVTLLEGEVKRLNTSPISARKTMISVPAQKLADEAPMFYRENAALRARVEPLERRVHELEVEAGRLRHVVSELNSTGHTN